MAHQEVQNGGPKEAAEVKFTAVKPHLMVEASKAVDAVQFYKTAFNAVEAGRNVYPKRKAEQELPHIVSSQLELAGSTILVSGVADYSAPVKTEGAGCVLCLETEDVEAAIAKAVGAGAVEEGEITENNGAFCGGRVGKVKDPYGYLWLFCSPAKEPANVEA